MSTKPTVLALAGVACAAVLIAGPQTAQAHPRAHTGKLKVKPGDVMVNTIVTVTGKGFAPNSSVTLRECGRTSWLVPEEVCNTENAVTVQTGRGGRFATPFKAQVCPEGSVGKGADRTDVLHRRSAGVAGQRRPRSVGEADRHLSLTRGAGPAHTLLHGRARRPAGSVGRW